MVPDPPRSPAEALTRHFYAWEERGRGWRVSPYPVDLEPPYRPFPGHYIQVSHPAVAVDDARKPTALGSLVARAMARLRSVSEQNTCPEETEVDELDDVCDPEPCDDVENLVTLSVALPPDAEVNRDRAAKLLIALGGCRHPVSFELVGKAGAVALQIACAEADRLTLVEQFEAFFPEVAVREAEDRLSGADDAAVVVDFGLSEECMRPLARAKGFAVDPLTGIVAALGVLREDEFGLLQVLFQPARHPWADAMLRAVGNGQGGSFFADAPEMLPLTRLKVASPLFAAAIRVAARAAEETRAWELVQGIAAGLAQLTDPASNALIPLTNDDYADPDHWHDVLDCRSRRSGMLLSADELVGLVHLPSASVRSERLERQAKKTRAAPVSATGHALVLGENTHRGTTTAVTLSPAHRVRHTYVLGASGSGKSTLLLNMILQDINRGEGLGVLDPHGDLIDEILGRIPKARHQDVVLFDPADEACPVGFNILQAHSELEKNLLSSDLVGLFRRFATSWGDQMTAVLGNAVLAFLESEGGGTLFDLRRFLVHDAFRRRQLDTVQDAEVRYFFEKEFPLLGGRPQGSILTRLNTFLRPKLVRYVVAQKDARLDLAHVMNEGKILLVKLAQGAIGEENAHLLGALLVSKLHQLILGRQEQQAAARRNFWLYIDEFHHFVTPSLALLLSGARKYALGLILAHQELQQLWAQDRNVASAVVANPATRICFRLGDFDAKKLADGFASFDARDLQNLSIGEAICRLERADQDFTLRTLPLADMDLDAAEENREAVIARSRAQYGRPRAEIEAELAKYHPAPAAEPASADTIKTPPPEPALPKREKAAKPSLPAERSAFAPRPEPELAPPPPPTSGRGGREHKYLQELVKRLAQDRGWRTTIEQPVLDRTGAVDVALEKDGQTVACEISVSTSVEHELSNVQKCVAAGYDRVVLVASDKKIANKLEKATTKELSAESHERVQVLQPEDLVAYLDALMTPEPAENTVRGYRVKVSYKRVGKGEEDAKRQAISQVLVRGQERVKRS